MSSAGLNYVFFREQEAERLEQAEVGSALYLLFASLVLFLRFIAILGRAGIIKRALFSFLYLGFFGQRPISALKLFLEAGLLPLHLVFVVSMLLLLESLAYKIRAVYPAVAAALNRLFVVLVAKRL